MLFLNPKPTTKHSSSFFATFSPSALYTNIASAILKILNFYNMNSPEKENTNCSNGHQMMPLDPEELRRQGHMIVDSIADYYKNIEKYPVLSQVKPGYLRKLLSESAPYDPEPVETILQDVQSHIIPGMTDWQSPNFFAFFNCNCSTAGFIGEMLSSGFHLVGFNWISSPALTELESIVTDWLGEMLQLPSSFLFSGNGGGVIHGSTCEAILCILIAARDQILSQVGKDKLGKLVVYCSDQTHSTFQKGAKISGIHPENFRAIKTDKSTWFALSPDALKLAIESDVEAGLIPLFLCATLGTTSTTAIDPLKPLCDVAKEHNIWVHVDAAYAGSACICPEFRHFLDGVENANSFSFNPHKWLFTTLDCCCLWVKDPSALVKSLSTYPEYLRNEASDSAQVVDYKDWQISLTRRFRGIKLWLVLRSFGVSNLRTYIRKHVELAKLFEGLVMEDKRFEIATPRNFSLVCFRMLSKNGKDNANELNKKLLDSVNASEHIYITHTVMEGVYIIRFAVGGSLTEAHHISTGWKLIQQHAETILAMS